MRLIDLLEVLADSVKLEIWADEDEQSLGRHDGKNSIDPKYNECQVVKVYHGRNELDVIIGGAYEE